MTHEWRLDRDWLLLDRTIGRLYECAANTPDPATWCNGDTWLCFTGEDLVRQPIGAPWDPACKIHGATAIPRGRYRVVLDYSARFKKIMPHILAVPSFSGIRIHGARAARPVEFSTLGCPCVGMEHDSEGIYDCAPAMRAVVALLEQAEKAHEEVWVTVT